MKNLVRRAAIASAEIPFGRAQRHLIHHPAPPQIPSRRVAARHDAVIGAQNDTSAIAILKHDLLPSARLEGAALFR